MTARYDVAFPLLALNPSGGVRMLLHVANELAARGARVAVSAPAGTTPPVRVDERVIWLRRRAGGGVHARTAFVSALPRADVQIASGYQTPVLIAAGLRLHRDHARMVYLIQNDEIESHVRQGSAPGCAKPLLAAIARSGYHIEATRIAVSRYVAQRAAGVHVHRVIAPGIDARFLRPVEAREAHERVRVGVLAHPGRVKGLALAIAAFDALRGDARIEPVVFDGAHPAPLPDWLAPFSALQPQSAGDIDAFYSFCDVFVFPSLVEGFGLPPLEAMARGAAVVLSDSGGVREYARPGQNCLLVPSGDVHGLVSAIQRVASDLELRRRLADAGRRTAEHYPVETFARECADEIQRTNTF